MVDLPKVPRRLVTVEEPRSGLTARDIAAPYATLAQGMSDVGEALTSTAEAHAEDAAARAVTVGPDGEMNVERTAIPMVGPAGKKYEHYIKAGAVAAADTAADRDLIELREANRDDPAGFRAAADRYRDDRVAAISSTVSPAAGQALKRQIDNRTTQTWGSLLNQHQTKALARADTDLEYRIKTMEDEAETLARRNGIGPEFNERIENIRALRSMRVSNPNINYPQARADAEMDALNTRVHGAAIMESTERVYRERGFDAARTHLRESVRAIDGGKVKQLDKIEREGLSLLRGEEARLKGDRDGIAREWGQARPLLDRMSDAELEDIQTRAAAVGNTRVATDVAVTRRALETKAAVRSLPIEDQVRAVGTPGGAPSNLVNRIVGAESGGDPNARPPINPATGLPSSTALGTGQFTKDTWREMIQRYRPELAQGKTDAEVLALRTNPELSREMVGRYAEQNKQQLGAAGVRTDDGALYLAHFLGPGDAIKVLSAPPGTPLAGLVNQASIDANRGIFGRNPTTDALTGWAAGKVGGAGASPENRADLLARQMLKKDLAGDLTTTLAGVNARVARGEFPDADEMGRLGSLVSVVGTPEQRRQTATLTAMSQVGAEFQNMPAAQRDALVSQIETQIKAGGGQAESDLTQALRTADKAITTAYQTDPYGAYYRYGRGEGARPTPAVNFGNAPEAGLILNARVKQQSVIREEQGIGPFSVLRPPEAEAFRGVMATGNAQAVAGSLAALNSLPDDVLAATLANDDVRKGITNAIHTTDPEKMKAVMSTLDTWYRRDPQAFNTRFPGTWDALVTWRDNTRYMNAEQFTAHQTKIQDPGQAAIHKKNVETGRTDALKVTPADLTAEMSPFFSLPSLGIGAPVVPTDPAVRDRFMADYVNIYSQRYADTLDKGAAKAQAIERLGQKWSRSAVNGNEVMLRAPETVYPMVNGAHDWVAPQIEAAIAEQMGVQRRPTFKSPGPGGVEVTPLTTPNWDYRLVSDATTEQEAQRYDRRLPAGDGNKPPSYQVIVRDNRRQTPRWEPAERRFALDPNEPQESGRQRFEAERAAEQDRRARLGDTLLGTGSEFPQVTIPAQKKTELTQEQTRQTGEDMTSALRARFGNPPPALRFFAETLAGDRSNITEASFTGDELEILRETAEKRLAEGKKVIGYGDYGPGEEFEKSFGTRRPIGPDNPLGARITWPSGTESALHALSDTRSSLGFTLGMARVRREDDGTIVITDKYDFAASKKQVGDLKSKGTWAVLSKAMEGLANNGLLGVGNVLGNLATPDGGGRPVEIRIPPKRG